MQPWIDFGRDYLVWPTLSMRALTLLVLIGFSTLVLPVACVDPLDLSLRATVNVIVVDGSITNLPETQIIRLNRSRADSITGRFGNIVLTNARVEVVVDSTQVITCYETIAGSYQLPSDFRGQVGHAYQLQFTLKDGTHYQSTQQVMPPVPVLNKLTLRFSTTSLPTGLLENFRAGYDVLIDTQDPAAQPNYYRWDWNLYEKQDWCKSCSQGYYMTNKLSLISSFPQSLVYRAEPDLLEDCFNAPATVLATGQYRNMPYFVNDYPCRTQCWDIIHNTALNLFSDQSSDGGLIESRNVGQIPYYTQNPALAEIRQVSLTADAYRFFKLFQDQTQNTGGLADAPPAALVGNVTNVANGQEKVVGYFTASGVSSLTSWLTKKDASGRAYGAIGENGQLVPGDQQLLFALTRRVPTVEVPFNYFSIIGGSSRPPTALCISSDSRTPFKPIGWRD